MSRMRALVRRLEADQSALEAEELASICAAPGFAAIDSVQQRQQVSVSGVVHSVTLPPSTDAVQMHAELYDGSGILTLIWLGRREIPGIRAGIQLRAHGRVTELDDRPVIFNPAYELLAPGRPHD